MNIDPRSELENNSIPLRSSTSITLSSDDCGYAHGDMYIHNLDAYNKHLIGRILTLLEASIQDGKQLNALKNLVKQDFWNARDVVWKWMSVDHSEEPNNFDSFPFKQD